MLCVKCGCEKESEARVCQKCGAALPRYVSEETPPPPVETPVVNERLQIFEDAVARVTSGEWSVEEFVNFLDDISAVLAEKEQDIRSIEIPDEAADDFAEELSVGFAGIELYNEGIGLMYSYVESGDPELLAQGLESIRRGNEDINEAMRINRENRSKLDDVCGTPLL